MQASLIEEPNKEQLTRSFILTETESLRENASKCDNGEEIIQIRENESVKPEVRMASIKVPANNIERREEEGLIKSLFADAEEVDGTEILPVE